MTIEARQYQADDVNYAMNHGKEAKVIHCAATGSGKTVTQALVCKRELDRGDSTAILTPRNEIFDQTFAMTSEVCGHGNVTMLRAKRQDEYWDPVKPVHIVSWPTMISRARKSKFFFPNVRRVLVDECHLSMAPKILNILEHYAPKAIIDGYTATPARMTGKGLGRFFTEIKHVTTVRQLIKDGYLCPVEYWGGATPDLAGIKIQRGDYEVGKLSSACVTLVGDVVDNWLRLAADRHTIVFAVDIAHCEMLAHRFKSIGIRAAALHVRMDPEERAEIVRLFKAGAIQVLVNVSIASYGFDDPRVNCVVIARPTKSIVLHLQMIGRGMRPGIDANGERITDPNDPDFKTCIAKGQLVLTDVGLVPIEQVTREMQVWDGVEFVYHGGVQSRGKRKVICYAGLTATPDHEVWTAKGEKRQFIDCANEGLEIAVTESQGAPIRADRGIVRSNYQRQKRPSNRVGEVRGLWSIINAALVKCGARHGRLSSLRAIWKWITKMAYSPLQHGKATMRESTNKWLQAIWRSRDQVSIQVTTGDGLLGIGEHWDQKGPPDRQEKQRWALRARKSSLVNIKTEYEQHICNQVHDEDCSDTGKSSTHNVCNEHISGVHVGGYEQPADRRSVQSASSSRPEIQEEVFDIINAGPLHRFTVSGLLVSNCVVLDHAGNVHALGQADDLFRWRLDEGKKACENWSRKEASGEKKDSAVHTCEECSHIFSQSRVCPKCGWKVPFSKRDVDTKDANLVRIGKKLVEPLPEGWPSFENFYRMLIRYGAERGYKPGWASVKFKEKCGEWPERHWANLASMPVDYRVANWITSRNIAYAKARKKAATG